MSTVTLTSGITIDLGDPISRFFAEEWAYYDGIPDTDPDHILPVDVLATVAMNSFVNSAAQVREVHRGLAKKVDRVLRRIPVDADLRTFDVEPVRELFAAACSARGVLMPVATKVLHRKRRALIPMLDRVVLYAYLDALGRSGLKAKLEDGTQAPDVGMVVLKTFRTDLLDAWDPLERVAGELEAKRTPVTPLRVLEVAVWIATEERGYYRSSYHGSSSS